MPSRAAYRARQAAQALFPRLGGAHVDQARALLSGGEMALFLSMAKRDQRHGLRVMEHLRREGQTDQDLLAAALLHDCGKGDVPVWLRVAYVLRPAYVEALAKKAAPQEVAAEIRRDGTAGASPFPRPWAPCACRRAAPPTTKPHTAWCTTSASGPRPRRRQARAKRLYVT